MGVVILLTFCVIWIIWYGNPHYHLNKIFKVFIINHYDRINSNNSGFNLYEFN